jgi:hypothetical protein
MGGRFLRTDTLALLLSLGNVGASAEESFGVPYCSQKAFNFLGFYIKKQLYVLWCFVSTKTIGSPKGLRICLWAQCICSFFEFDTFDKTLNPLSCCS